MLPSPNGFYADWSIKGNEHNTLSPLTWSTPVVGTGPSFLRDDLAPLKRKSPDLNNGAHGPGGGAGAGGHHYEGAGSGETVGNEPKRLKVEH